MRRKSAGLVLLGILLWSGSVAAWEVETLHISGPAENRINLVIMGDGYTSAQQQKLTQDSMKLLENLFGHSPFAEYLGLFNIKLVKVISAQDGATDGSYGGSRNTALGAYFNCNNIDRLLCVDNAAVFQTAIQHVPEYDFIVVVVNDSKYGGAGGQIATTSIAQGALDILPHELGHTIGDLADEYDDPYPGYTGCSFPDCPEANASRFGSGSGLKWHFRVAAGTPLPTPKQSGYSGIGAFEGARYQSTGIFRPTENSCLMRQLGKSFCPVCAEAMVRSFWEHVWMADAVSPSQMQFTAQQCQPLDFELELPELEHPLGVNWEVNNVPQATSSSRLSLPANSLALGQHQISATTVDDSGFFVPTMEHSPQKKENWSVQVVGCTIQPSGSPCQSDHQCESGHCSEGFCCESSCSGACESCGLAGNIGQCVPLSGAPEPSSSCSGALCHQGQCLGSCATDGDCIAGHFCGSDALCHPLAETGQSCQADEECISGICSDGVCCDEICDGPCRSCASAQSPGQCTELNGPPTPSQNCGGLVCNKGSCLQQCQQDSECVSGICQKGKCVPKKGLGQSCALDSQCESNFCVDGFCCSSRCAGECESCTLSPNLGLCTALSASENPSCQRPKPSGPPATSGCTSGCSTGGNSAWLSVFWLALFSRRQIRGHLRRN